MAHENKVIRSINAAGDLRCVDIFARPDGSFGYEEYRRDVEDNRGWFPIGHYGGSLFETAEAALAAAKKNLSWLNDTPQS